MREKKKEAGTRSLTGIYSLIMMLYWAEFAVVYGYASVYLLGMGYSNTRIGVVLAAAALGAVLLQLLITEHMKDADALEVKRSSAILAGCFLAAGAALVLIGSKVGTAGAGANAGSGNGSAELVLLAAVCIIYGIMALIVETLTPFLNSLATVSAASGANINFGIARGLASGAYSLVSFFAGHASAAAGVRIIPVITLPLCALLLILLLKFPAAHAGRQGRAETAEGHGTAPEAAGNHGSAAEAAGSHGSAVETGGQKGTASEGTAQNEKAAKNEGVAQKSGEAGKQQKNLLSLLRENQRFATVLFGTLCIYICHLLVNTYAFQIVSSKGGGDAELGIGTAVAALTEIPVMILMGIYRKKIHAGRWILVAGIVYFIRCIGYLFLPSVGGYYAMQLLQVMSWAVLGVVTVYYVSEVLKAENEVRGQACFTMAFSLATVLSSLLGGVLIDWKGVSAMLICAAAFAAAGILLNAAAQKRQ